MSNLLPPSPKKAMGAELRARFLLAVSLVLFCSAVLFALTLAPAEAALVFFPSAAAKVQQEQVNNAQDAAAITHSKALLAAMQLFSTTTSLADVTAALSDLGSGISVDDISYSIASHSLTLGGHSEAPGDVNALRQALQNDTHFGNISVPVSALLGSQGGGFTISMNVTQ